MNRQEIEEVRARAIRKKRLNRTLTAKEKAKSDAKDYKALMKNVKPVSYVTKEMSKKEKKLLGLK